MTTRYPPQATWEPPVHGESAREAKERRARNRAARDERYALMDARCSVCGHVRGHVEHEMDPENSPEGAAYHADFDHHAFVEVAR